MVPIYLYTCWYTFLLASTRHVPLTHRRSSLNTSYRIHKLQLAEEMAIRHIFISLVVIYAVLATNAAPHQVRRQAQIQTVKRSNETVSDVMAASLLCNLAPVAQIHWY